MKALRCEKERVRITYRKNGQACFLHNGVEVTGRKAEHIAAYEDAEAQGRLLILPSVPDKDRRSVLDLYRDARKEWIHDPSVGLYGPNENETALMDAIEQVLEAGRPQECAKN